MTRRASILLLAAALAAHGACFAQGLPDAVAGDAPVASAAASDPALPAAPQGETRSAFGRVMAVMIRALQHQSGAPSQTVAPVRTTAAGTPMDIEVGANFRDALEGGAIRARQKTGTGGAAAAPSPRAAPPENLALRQATAARPD
ncbi:MAG: hypothetical protein ACTHOC_09485 [Luteimonas sp.]